MPNGTAPAAAAGPTLPAALLQARRENAAARFGPARALAAPLFHEARDAGDWVVAAEAALLMARACGNQREGAEALRWAHEAQQAATLAERPALVCASWVETAREHALEEEGALAQRAIDEALALVPALERPDEIETAYSGLTAVYSELGLTGLALSCGRHALEHAESAGDLARISMARTNFLFIGCLACRQAREADTAGVARLLMELHQQLEQLQIEVPKLGSALAQARLWRVTGALAVCESRWKDAQHAFQALVSNAEGLPAHLVCSTWVELGFVQRSLGLDADARASGQRAWACNPTPDAPRRWADLERQSQIMDLIGQPQEALVLLRRSQDSRNHIVMSALDSRAATLSARLDEQTLRVENEGLRRSNASLRASVASISQLAVTDPLTGLLNRRGLEQAWLDIESANDGPRVLGLVDVDHFKRVNDGHSHIVGDAVLRQIARLLNEELRGGDRMARYGGEEFAVLLVGADAQAAGSVFERLRRVVQDHDWRRIGPGLSITISAGLVLVGHGESFVDAAARADRLLYIAKATGRNRCVDALAQPQPDDAHE